MNILGGMMKLWIFFFFFFWGGGGRHKAELFWIVVSISMNARILLQSVCQWMLGSWCIGSMHARIVAQYINEYLYFQSKPSMNLLIFATVHSLINDTKFDWQLPSYFARAIRFEHECIRQLWHWCRLPSSHTWVARAKQASCCSICCRCSHWLFRFSVIHSNKTANTIKY